ncbi:MAG: type VI secretion system lipoprotein TssJ [Acetobacteraceae bacterium]|nr:type VI secretion system lipoprotein TssJ [Acetobacteraceae bacterium]
MKRVMLLGFLDLAGMAGCAPAAKPPPVLNLTISGTEGQNPDAFGKASPVGVRIYQLNGSAKFEQSDVFALKDFEVKTLGTELQGSGEYLIAPNEKKIIKIDLKPLVSTIGVAVMYRDIDKAKWRATVPAAANGPTNLSVTTGTLALAINADAKQPGILDKIGVAAGLSEDAAAKAAAAIPGAALEQVKGLAGDALKSKLLPGGAAASGAQSQTATPSVSSIPYGIKP